MKKQTAFFLTFLLPFSLFCQRIVSPVEGTFANRQPLVINLDEGEEAFYSYSSVESRNDPMDSGFAYDSPVFIEQSGNIILKVAVVSPLADGNIERYEIRYRVQGNPNPFDAGSAESAFVSKLMQNPVFSVSSSLEIPPSLKYSFGDSDATTQNFLGGKTLSLSPLNCLPRLVPFCVTDGKSVWRFLIDVKVRNSENLSQNEDFPFKITDWEKIEFTGKNLIYQLDDEYWSASKKPFFVDRSVPHVLSCQSVAYEKGNPVQTFILPPKPELEKVYDSRAAVFSLKGNADYKLQIFSINLDGNHTSKSQNQKSKNDSLYTQAVFDVFDGEEISGKAEFEVYLDGVPQGKLQADFDVDKKPPLPPVFKASAPGFYTRSDVDLKISAEYGAEIFAAFTGPHALEAGTYSENSPALQKYEKEISDFKPYDFKTFRLRSGKKAAVYFKFAAYAVDSAGNKSPVSEYKLIIDKFNYFIDFSSLAENPDGSGGKPFNKISQVLKVIDESDFAHFFVVGNFDFPAGETLIKSNCAFTGTGSKKSKITFEPDSFLTVSDASISFANCLIQKDFIGPQKSDSRMFVLENAAAEFDSCQIYENSSENAILINSSSSAVSFNSSQVSLKSQSYACAVSASDCEVSAQNCNFSAVSETASVFSLSTSSLNLESSSAKITCHMGRVIESEKSNLKMTKNKFTASFDEKKPNQAAIFKDEKTLVIEDKGNEIDIRN